MALPFNSRILRWRYLLLLLLIRWGASQVLVFFFLQGAIWIDKTKEERIRNFGISHTIEVCMWKCNASPLAHLYNREVKNFEQTILDKNVLLWGTTLGSTLATWKHHWEHVGTKNNFFCPPTLFPRKKMSFFRAFSIVSLATCKFYS